MIRFYPVVLVGLVASFISCGAIPTDSNDGNLDANGVYVSDLWGFRVSLPDTTWGLQAQTFPQNLASNGVPQLELWMLSPVTSEVASFRPILYLKPDAQTVGDTQSQVVVDLETELKGAFDGYVAQGKSTIAIDSETGTQWLFQANPVQGNFMPGNQFWVAVVLHNQSVYLFLGNGITDFFPVSDYRKVALGLKFQ